MRHFTGYLPTSPTMTVDIRHGLVHTSQWCPITQPWVPILAFTDEPPFPKATGFCDSLLTSVLSISSTGCDVQLLHPFVFWIFSSYVPWGGE